MTINGMIVTPADSHIPPGPVPRRQTTGGKDEWWVDRGQCFASVESIERFG